MKIGKLKHVDELQDEYFIEQQVTVLKVKGLKVI